jgi:hypothetical protein
VRREAHVEELVDAFALDAANMGNYALERRGNPAVLMLICRGVAQTPPAAVYGATVLDGIDYGRIHSFFPFSSLTHLP